MNNPSPLIPQGSMFEQKNNNRARVRMAVFLILTVHVVGLMALLMQGCRQPTDEAEPVASYDTNDFPTFEVTNTPELFLPETNVTPYVPPLPVPETNSMRTTVPPAAGAQEYTVMRGDTFSGLASRFGVTVRQIQEANPNVEPTRLQLGQKLVIPAPVPAGTTPPTTGSVPAGNGQVYTVKSGDTLTAIARE
jgi:LysM repeat protein